MHITLRRWAGVTIGIGVAGAVVAGALTGLPASAAEDDQLASIVEDYSYPGADRYTDIKLVSGDGNIMMVECDPAAPSSAEVWSYTRAEPFCFEFRGDTGYVALELAEVYGIRNREDFDMAATVTVDDRSKTVPVVSDDWTGVGVGAGENQALLLELRA